MPKGVALVFYSLWKHKRRFFNSKALKIFFYGKILRGHNFFNTSLTVILNPEITGSAEQISSPTQTVICLPR